VQPATRPLEIDERLVVRHDKDRPHGFDPSRYGDPTRWSRRVRNLWFQATVAMGLWPIPPRVPMNPVIHGAIDRGDYTVEKVFFTSLPGHYVSGNLYRPTRRTGRLPAVLSPYGHWENGRFIWRTEEQIDKELAIGGERTREAARSPLQARCAMLARMGCVVFHHDMVGYCDSTEPPHREGFLDVQAILHLQSYMGLITWNGLRALEFLTSLPEVDGDRVALTGASSGASQSIALAAVVGDRIAAHFPVVMVSMNMQGGCVCENAPLYRVHTNNVELAAMAAPRPVGVVAANDWTKDFETRGLPEMKAIWETMGAADAIEGKHLDFPHNYNVHSRERMYAFMNRRLGLGWPQVDPERIDEVPFEPIHPNDLSVYTAEHPRPADTADAKAIREWMTRTAREELEALKREARGKYDSPLRSPLKALVADDLPGRADVEWVAASETPAAQRGFLRRLGTNERVPATLWLPNDWTGGVCVYADGDGAAATSDTPPAPVARLLTSGFAVLSAAVFLAGSFQPPDGSNPRAGFDPPPKNVNPRYAGYWLGYERSVIAERVHDLLTAITHARKLKPEHRVSVACDAAAAPWTIIAVAMISPLLAGATIEWDGWDFDGITADDDPLLLPGALKYGGLRAFLETCECPVTRVAPDR
jgi:hypothetical protein